MIPVSWPAGVPQQLRREGYRRTPQDVVRRHRPETGPALRRLMDGSCGQRVEGRLSLTAAEAELFQAWHEETLDRGMQRFDWVITDSGEAVVARLAAQPILTITAGRRHFQLDIECDAPGPAPGALAALAALEDEPPASWPSTVPFRPLRGPWSAQAGDSVLRSPAEGVQRQSLSSRAEGAVWQVTLRLSSDEKSAFEGWFRTDAAFGARDIFFPDLQGGEVLGHFHEIYTVTPAQTAKWDVAFKLYIEAVT